MFNLAHLICLLQALNLAQSLPSHNLHEQPHNLIHRQAKSPQDLTTLGIQVIPTPLNEPKNVGSVNPALETKGITSIVPFVTNVPTASVRQKADPYSQVLLAPQVAQPTRQAVVNGIFDNPIDTARPPSTIGTKNDHPQPKTGIVSPRICSIEFRIHNLTFRFRLAKPPPLELTNSTLVSFWELKLIQYGHIHTRCNGVKGLAMQSPGVSVSRTRPQKRG